MTERQVLELLRDLIAGAYVQVGSGYVVNHDKLESNIRERLTKLRGHDQ